jgi:hypothetical protein
MPYSKMHLSQYISVVSTYGPSTKSYVGNNFDEVLD